MPKYWVKNYFAHGRFPEVGQEQKTERKKEEEERLNDGDNNGQLRMAHASRLGQKIWQRCFGQRNVTAVTPGPLIIFEEFSLNWPRRLACAMRSLAIVITNFRALSLFFLSFSSILA